MPPLQNQDRPERSVLVYFIYRTVYQLLISSQAKDADRH